MHVKRNNGHCAARDKLFRQAASEKLTQKSLATHGQRYDISADGMCEPLNAFADVFMTEDSACNVRIGYIFSYEVFKVRDDRKFRRAIRVFIGNVNYIDRCTGY